MLSELDAGWVEVEVEVEVIIKEVALQQAE
jgi:hypothetical protein